MSFVKATKKKSRARVALVGPSGSGKTYTALLVAKTLGARIAVIDTERGSASKYAGDVADFDVCELGTFEPKHYIQALKDAAASGFDVVVVDSMSHAWEGTGGLLDQVDARGGRFEAWKDMAPQLRAFIDAILAYPGHVIVTMRSKTEWVVEQVEKKGRMVSEPRKIGLAPKFKEGMEYEFDIVGELDNGTLHISKSRCPALTGEYIKHPGAPLAKTLLQWLDQGVEVEPPPPPPPKPLPRASEHAKEFATKVLETGMVSMLADELVPSTLPPHEQRALRVLMAQRRAEFADAAWVAGDDKEAIAGEWIRREVAGG
jgi:hypothetical protein